MSFIFQNGNVSDLEKRIEILEGYHKPSSKDTKLSTEKSENILTENGLILKTE